LKSDLRLLFPLLLLTVFLASCGPAATVALPTPEAMASPQPSDMVASLPPSSTPRAVPPTATATFAPPSPTPIDSPTAMAATVTPTPRPATATSSAIPPTATALPSPTSTPTAAAGQSKDPVTIQVEVRPVVAGLDQPLGIVNAGDGSGWLYVLEKVGRIRIVRSGTLVAAPFLDISDRVNASANERGLLGLAFHPRYAENGFFYVNYTNHQGNTVIARFAMSSDAAQGDRNTESVLLTLDQPAANHNGGNLAFGPDGYLYIGTGDGGGAGDQYGNGQNGNTLLGAMLRLDVDGGQPYAIPSDNPFVDSPGVRDEIWAVGLRNPWRYSFDRLTGDLYIGDVGQNQYEEVDFQPAGSAGGQNYGWPTMEGLHCYPADRPCDRGGLTLPIEEYDHSQGCSVTGGYVYRGKEVPLLAGIYLFGDYCSGNIWGLMRSGEDEWQAARMAQVEARISSFGEDEAGELYVVDISGGVLYRIEARPRS
jgi:glucose/arabinose dehydrogenase